MFLFIPSIFFVAGILLLSASFAGKEKVSTIKTIDSETNWSEYNGDVARSHYSPLTQINRENLGSLKIAWTYASGGADTTGNRSQIQCNPLIIDGILYGVSANTQAFAVDAATGKEIWKTSLTDNGGTTSRGLTYFKDEKTARLFFGAGRWLYAMDAKTGNLIDEFGDRGRLDLKPGLNRPGADNYVSSNTPNTIYKNLIITGVRVSESETALLGDIRAFDVHSGKLIWTFRTIPAKGDPGYETWTPAEPRKRLGGANAWAGMALDKERGIVYIPTGSAAFDFYGGNRKGNNLYANCLIALDAATGKKRWHYQLVHHDIWDRDPPSTPNLLTVVRNGKKIDAVAQITKQGFVFVFDRVSGKPLFDIVEKKFPTAAVSGEVPSATQPIPLKPTPFTRQSFTEREFSPFVADKDSLVKLLRAGKTGSAYIPLTQKMTIFFPGTDGGAQWGGAATDPNGIMYVPAKEVPVYSSLIKRESTGTTSSLTGARLYTNHCAACHGKDKKGNHDGSIPSLIAVDKRLNAGAVAQILNKGKGMMPSFSHLPEQQRKVLTDYLFNKSTTAAKTTGTGQVYKSPYQHTGYNRWYDRNGYPVIAPPWGTLTAIDLNTGDRKWQIALGEYSQLIKQGMPPTGTDNYGGPVATASRLLFIAATRDEKFRAIDSETGKILWETKLPAAGYATPSTYSVHGKQFIVIACGGGKLGTKSGDQYVAFSLINSRDQNKHLYH